MGVGVGVGVGCGVCGCFLVGITMASTMMSTMTVILSNPYITCCLDSERIQRVFWLVGGGNDWLSIGISLVTPICGCAGCACTFLVDDIFTGSLNNLLLRRLCVYISEYVGSVRSVMACDKDNVCGYWSSGFLGDSGLTLAWCRVADGDDRTRLRICDAVEDTILFVHAKPAQSNSVKLIHVPSMRLQTILIHSITMSVLLCTAVLSSGKRKGELCGNRLLDGMTRCKRHSKESRGVSTDDKCVSSNPVVMTTNGATDDVCPKLSEPDVRTQSKLTRYTTVAGSDNVPEDSVPDDDDDEGIDDEGEYEDDIRHDDDDHPTDELDVTDLDDEDVIDDVIGDDVGEEVIGDDEVGDDDVGDDDGDDDGDTAMVMKKKQYTLHVDTIHMKDIGL